MILSSIKFNDLAAVTKKTYYLNTNPSKSKWYKLCKNLNLCATPNQNMITGIRGLPDQTKCNNEKSNKILRRPTFFSNRFKIPWELIGLTQHSKITSFSTCSNSISFTAEKRLILIIIQLI